MTELRYVLSGEGSSDAMLLPILNWLLRTRLPNTPLNGDLADDDDAGGHDVASRVRQAVADYPCDLLFVHRDTDARPPAERRAEIEAACAGLRGEPPHVCVIPVRMSEAWLLTDESAIRRAADNSRGKTPIKLPPVKTLEKIADPRAVLIDLIRVASEQTGRRLDKLRPRFRFHLVAEYIGDFAPLRQLPAFQQLEADIAAFAAGWLAANPPPGAG